MRRIAGESRQAPEVLSVNWKDVLDQSVANERERVLREVEKAVRVIPIRRGSQRQYIDADRNAADFRADLLKRLDGIREAQR